MHPTILDTGGIHVANSVTTINEVSFFDYIYI